MNQKELRRYLNVIKRAVSLIEGMLENDDDGLLEQFTNDLHITHPHAHQQVLPQPAVAEFVQNVAPPPPSSSINLPNFGPTPEELEKIKAARKKHIDSLMAIDCWPEAVPHFLANKEPSEEDQINRANAVLDMMLDRQVEDCNFLDFGCGDGWISKQALKRGVAESTGFDIKTSDNWQNIKDVNFISNLSDLKKSYYDVVFLYDVLDHCEDPLFVMDTIKTLVKSDGVVYVRCHPWVSKHATHLYKQGINKAYLHLFLTYQEIQELIQQSPNFTRMEKNPLAAYHWWFKDFDIKKERFVREPISDFFFVPAFKELLSNEQDVPLEHIDEFMKGLEIQFIDYILLPKKS